MMDNNIIALIDALRVTTVSVHFTKVDGSDRSMLCTLNPMLIPVDKMPVAELSDENFHTGETLAVFEVDLQNWRSFRTDNVIDWRINQATDLGEDA